MSGRSFRSVFMVASCAGAALACYLVSLRVASERAALEDVEQRIVLAQRDIRVLQTEIGTRGRLAQLEKWNAKVLALSAPSADQFLDGGFALAKLTRPQEQIEIDAPVVLASAPAPERNAAPLDEGPAETNDDRAGAVKLMHQASVRMPPREAQPVEPNKTVAAPPSRAASRSKPAAPVTPSSVQSAAKKTVDNQRLADAKPVTKPVRVAKGDPLAPLPDSGSKKTAKDSGSAR